MRIITPELLDFLRKKGLKVAETPGWQGRGKELPGKPLGALCHHTAGPKDGNMPSLQTLINGRPDLPGPLAQFGPGRDGTVYVVADGRANHAGIGEWHGITMGNSFMIGIEAENTGLPEDSPWPKVQIEAYNQLCAALAEWFGWSADANDTRPADHIAGHKEYALPHGRKSDPDFDMPPFRDAVQGLIDGTIPAPTPIPPVDPTTGYPTLRRGATGDPVRVVQAKVGVTVDGNFGAKTEAAVRQFQRDHNLVPDGIVGPKSWALINE